MLLLEVHYVLKRASSVLTASITELREKRALMPSQQGCSITLVDCLGEVLPCMLVKTLNLLQHGPLVDLRSLSSLPYLRSSLVAP